MGRLSVRKFDPGGLGQKRVVSGSYSLDCFRNSVIWKTLSRRPISGVSDWTKRGLTMLRCQRDLFAAHVSSEDVGDYHVTEPGWYAVDDGEHVVLGPFTSLAECERNIRDHNRLAPKTV
jgi:hypothetical protein